MRKWFSHWERLRIMVKNFQIKVKNKQTKRLFAQLLGLNINIRWFIFQTLQKKPSHIQMNETDIETLCALDCNKAVWDHLIQTHSKNCETLNNYHNYYNILVLQCSIASKRCRRKDKQRRYWSHCLKQSAQASLLFRRCLIRVYTVCSDESRIFTVVTEFWGQQRTRFSNIIYVIS